MIDSFVDKAILEIDPNAKFSIDADDTSRITWLEGTSPISENDIISKINELRADYNSKEYQRIRQFKYDRIENQLDQLWHDINDDKLNKSGSWFKSIKAVKDKYPKE